MKKKIRFIYGVEVKKLKIIRDKRGRLMEILRCDDTIFKKFGQCYFTTVYPKVTKAWHCHRYQDDHFTCVKGKILLALYDARYKSPTFGLINEFILSLDNPMLVKIPRGVYHGFKAKSSKEAMVVNIPTNTYNRTNPDELRRPLDDSDINYDWSKK